MTDGAIQLMQWLVVMRLRHNAVSTANDQGLFEVGFTTAKASLNSAWLGCNAMHGRGEGGEDPLLLTPGLTRRQRFNGTVVAVLRCLLTGAHRLDSDQRQC